MFYNNKAILKQMNLSNSPAMMLNVLLEGTGTWYEKRRMTKIRTNNKNQNGWNWDLIRNVVIVYAKYRVIRSGVHHKTLKKSTNLINFKNKDDIDDKIDDAKRQIDRRNKPDKRPTVSQWL